jgi:hypothetical protein
VADALSQVSIPDSLTLFHLIVPQFLFLEELKQELLTDVVFLDMRERLLKDPSSLPDFRLVDGLLLKQGRIWISPSSRFK